MVQYILTKFHHKTTTNHLCADVPDLTISFWDLGKMNSYHRARTIQFSSKYPHQMIVSRKFFLGVGPAVEREQ